MAAGKQSRGIFPERKASGSIYICVYTCIYSYMISITQGHTSKSHPDIYRRVIYCCARFASQWSWHLHLTLTKRQNCFNLSQSKSNSPYSIICFCLRRSAVFLDYRKDSGFWASSMTPPLALASPLLYPILLRQSSWLSLSQLYTECLWILSLLM